jgi:hypothetical protein
LEGALAHDGGDSPGGVDVCQGSVETTIHRLSFTSMHFHPRGGDANPLELGGQSILDLRETF